MRYLVLFVLLLVPVAAHGSGNFLRYEVDGQPYEGYWVSPAQDAPFLLLVHDWDGLTDYEVKRAESLAAQGYAVFGVDLFGAGVRPTTTVDKKARTGELYADWAKMRALLNGALREAERQGARIENGVAFGYCFGGAAVLELARSGVGLKGFVAFHGGLATPDGQDYANTKGSVLIFHGSADSSVSLQDFADLAESLEQNGVTHEMITYSGAPHAFTVFGSPRYRADADQKSWHRFLRFLEETLQ